ncbi:MAG: radical SAM protein [Planctomycetota bacterium]
MFFARSMRIPPKLDPRVPPQVATPRQVLLINPFYPKDPVASYGKHVLTPTLALTSIAGATPEGWEVRYWDENLLQGPPPWKPFPEVVGITVHLTFARRAYALAKWFRERGARVILGGLHVESCPDEVAEHADAIAIGEGTQIWPRILEDIAGDRLEKVYHGSYLESYRGAPSPRRDILPRESFLTTSSMIATRGCHNRCGFCYLSTDGLRMPYQMRAAKDVAAEILADDQPYVVFIDNNLGSRPKYLRALCQELRPLEKIWSAAVTLDVTDDPSLVREMALSGCTGVFIGLESLNDASLAAANKKTPLAEDYARRIRILHDHGIQVTGSFVLGFDTDRPDIFERTIDWVEKVRLETATFHILTPYPGTPLFRQLEREGRLLHKDWSRYDTAHAVFRPKHMSPEQLEAGYRRCYRRLFSHASIWKRRPADSAAVVPYLAMAYLYKRSNWLWTLLIRKRWTHRVWHPIVEMTRRRHLDFRKELEGTRTVPSAVPAPLVVSPGV